MRILENNLEPVTDTYEPVVAGVSVCPSKSFIAEIEGSAKIALSIQELGEWSGKDEWDHADIQEFVDGALGQLDKLKPQGINQIDSWAVESIDKGRSYWVVTIRPVVWESKDR